MSQDPLQSFRDDIAYMKDVAARGRRGPLMDGTVLAAAGLIFGMASLLNYGVNAGLITGGAMASTVVWGSALLVFFTVLGVENIRLARRPGPKSVASRAARAGWAGVGLVIFVMSLSIACISWKMQSPIPSLIFPSLIFALYGAGWVVSATVSGQRWQWLLVIGCWMSAPLMGLLATEPVIWLAYAMGLFFFALAPGVMLMRTETATA